MLYFGGASAWLLSEQIPLNLLQYTLLKMDPLDTSLDKPTRPLDMPALFVCDQGGPGLSIEPSFVTIGNQLAKK